MRGVLFVAVVVAGTSILAVAQKHPSFEGTWNMDKVHSQYPAQSATELIHQQGQLIDVTITEKSPGHPNSPMQLHLSTDGKPVVSTVGPNKFTSMTHWEGDKLVTFVEGDRGQHMTETRQLSPDGKTLTVTGYHQDDQTNPYYVRVMVRSEP